MTHAWAKKCRTAVSLSSSIAVNVSSVKAGATIEDQPQRAGKRGKKITI